MSWMSSIGTTPLFIPELIGKDLKTGDSIPVVLSFFKERPSTSFSLSKESITVTDTGIYTINSIRDGIASLTYNGNETMTLHMKINDNPVNNVSTSVARIELSIDMKTGIVVNSTRTDTFISKESSGSPLSMDMKTVTTTKITRLE